MTSVSQGQSVSAKIFCTFLGNFLLYLCLNKKFLFYVTLLSAGGSVYFVVQCATNEQLSDQNDFTTLAIVISIALLVTHVPVLFGIHNFKKRVKLHRSWMIGCLTLKVNLIELLQFCKAYSDCVCRHVHGSSNVSVK
ncbi:hypothetical protein L596_009789 [Steinernema carpocapsae]|uniref:Uncharacterized protein n=1 Tax=Steinernema carpocapsae TaxID=34508 RepID=A0A4U5PGP4_STECR|nr:hypothetical protein L596_009789 [Steinernema carpocapsae]